MEMLCFGFLIGALTSVIFVGIGIVFGRGAEKKDERDKVGNTTSDNRDSKVLLHGRSDNVPDVSLRNRSRGGDERDDERMVEQALTVLEYFRVGACRYELEVIEWLEDKLNKYKAEYPLGRNDWQE